MTPVKGPKATYNNQRLPQSLTLTAQVTSPSSAIVAFVPSNDVNINDIDVEVS